MEGNYKSLTVYKKSFALAMDVFEITKKVAIGSHLPTANCLFANFIAIWGLSVIH